MAAVEREAPWRENDVHAVYPNGVSILTPSKHREAGADGPAGATTSRPQTDWLRA